MQKDFKDHFSNNSVSYSRHRPDYPDSLFSFLSSACSEHKLVWDCATGSGQSAVKLTKYFNKVIATDASRSQISNALQHQGINYYVCNSEESVLKDESADLITVAQALHWFDLPLFMTEVDRVLKPGGILAVWSYGLLEIQSDIDVQVEHLYSGVLKKYWPAERSLVEGGYQHIHFPYEELPAPSFRMALDWTLPQLTSYLSTWSAVSIYMSQNSSSPVELITTKLTELWGNPESHKNIQWPLTVRLWQKDI